MSEIIYKTNEEIELIRKSSLLVSETLAEVAKYLKPGVTKLEINKLIDEFVHSHNAYPIFKGYEVHGLKFPASACLSINDEVVHGMPTDRALVDGDIISVDVGVLMNEFVGDSAYTFAMVNVKATTLKLLKITKQSLYKGIAAAKVGNRIGDIGFAVQSFCEAEKYGVVTELVGHGVGRELHEEPPIPNIGKRGSGKKILAGMVIAIEPMINEGKKEVKILDDKWTYVTLDGKPSAHYEHTIAIRKEGPEILSTFSVIEEAERNNNNLVSI
jgi:methionyl aminopeptidase